MSMSLCTALYIPMEIYCVLTHLEDVHVQVVNRISCLEIIPSRQDNNISSLCFLIPFQDTLLMRELNILINNLTPA